MTDTSLGSGFNAFAIMAFLAISGPAAAQHGEGRSGEILFNVLGAIGGEAWDINREAVAVFESAPRAGGCAERRNKFLAVLSGALRFSRYARDIYSADGAAEMERRGLSTLDLGGGRRAYYHRSGHRYAETRLDPERQQIVVAFQGTRLSVGSDLATDVLNFIGAETPYYAWASSLVRDVMRDHPGMEVIATGDSLGGGLAIYAVLSNPGAKAFVFNPAGISVRTWENADRFDRERTNRAVTSISTRDLFRIEPVTALSLAGRSVLPGNIFIVKSSTLLPKRLHSVETMVGLLEQFSVRNDSVDCNAELGILAH